MGIVTTSKELKSQKKKKQILLSKMVKRTKYHLNSYTLDFACRGWKNMYIS